ncbi:acetolactate synthase catalytic subunit [Pseudarthrobacter oxydans]|uniref:acetolactate synthase catalytic subunit n=1 Tax=Pseudarthrobacter oxydans TaxID=1671 RepID=UPI002AA7C987|nr:acetolactate synthase catalytic subunit [Pseudarthrobacter oxydans]WPU11066.1 acetolactate synthase catalytic subunit [Pseudarthrobacter oxydans]
MPTVAEIMVAAFRRHGVTDVFGQSLPSAFFLAAEKAGIRQIPYRTENAGGAMADAFARVSNRIALVGAQNGPAATLLVPPLAEAIKASSPVIAIVQEVPVSQRGRNAFQEFDHVALFASCTKWVKQLDDPTRINDYVDMAVTIATTGRPGPVALLVPRDVLLMEVEQTEVTPRTSELGGFPLDRSRPDGARVAEAAKLLADAVSPLIVAGGGVHLSGAVKALEQLQELSGIPVATTNMGKGAVSEIHELSLGVIGNALGAKAPNYLTRPLVEDADVVLFVGTRTNENGTDAWKLFPRDATYIHLDVDGIEIGRNYQALRLVGDARLGLEDINAELGKLDLSRRVESRASASARIALAKTAAAADVQQLGVNQPPNKLTPQYVMSVLDGHLEADDIAVADASYSTLWMSNYLTAKSAGQRFISPRGLAGLGWGLPMAMGAQAAFPDKRVVCISGDGGYGHVWAEMEAAVRNNQPIVSVLLNNSILGFQKHAELNSFAEYTTAIPFSTVDHAAIARAVGAEATRVTTPAELETALKAAFSGNQFFLIEVITDADSYPAIAAWDSNPPESIR